MLDIGGFYAVFMCLEAVVFVFFVHYNTIVCYYGYKCFVFLAYI